MLFAEALGETDRFPPGSASASGPDLAEAASIHESRAVAPRPSDSYLDDLAAPITIKPSAVPLTPPMVPLPTGAKVTLVENITTSAGAETHFGTFPGIANLNAPGPVNDTQTGSCNLIHQIRFTFAAISTNEVSVIRVKAGERGTVGQEVKVPANTPDGPSAGTVIHNANDVVVVDGPGFSASPAPPGGTGQAGPTRSHASAFPIRYAMDFQLFFFDKVSQKILASASYSILIVKQSVSDPKPVMQLNSFRSAIH
jgi:hypothetical protein